MKTKQYKVLKPIGWNGRREKGSIINLTDVEASAYSPEYITPVVVEAPKVAEVPLKDRPIDDLKFAELKELALEMKLDTGGSKADILERIKLARQ
jgi:hypothetical protein